MCIFKNSMWFEYLNLSQIHPVVKSSLQSWNSIGLHPFELNGENWGAWMKLVEFDRIEILHVYRPSRSFDRFGLHPWHEYDPPWPPQADCTTNQANGSHLRRTLPGYMQ